MFNCRYHPFAVDAFFKQSLVVTYAAPVAALQPLIPSFLTLDTLRNEYAFLAAAFVDTHQLRPSGFPPALGNDFLLAGFRLFVRYTTSSGKSLRGLYILKSLTNKRRMACLGNFFTHYHYSSGHLQMTTSEHGISVRSTSFDIAVDISTTAEPALPPGSPFDSWSQAKRFAGPLPFTFTAANASQVLIVQGVRTHWQPAPVQLEQAHIGFVQQLRIPTLQPASAFLVSNIPYHWKKGQIDKWQQQ
jgi:hypothetical protein